MKKESFHGSFSIQSSLILLVFSTCIILLKRKEEVLAPDPAWILELSWVIKLKTKERRRRWMEEKEEVEEFFFEKIPSQVSELIFPTYKTEVSNSGAKFFPSSTRCLGCNKVFFLPLFLPLFFRFLCFLPPFSSIFPLFWIQFLPI